MLKDEFKRLIKEGLSSRKIGLRCNMSQTSVRYWLKKYGLKTDPYRHKDSYTCLFCGKNIKTKKYCNTSCQQNYQWAERKRSISENEEAPSKVSAIRYLKETEGDKCSICGLDEWQGKDIVLIMDHINGNSENNHISNLRLVCPNCDSQLSTFKGRNKGNGRHSRRVRYAENKSY